MDYQKKIQAKLKSLPINRDQREKLLATLIMGLERGGPDEAAAALTLPQDGLEDVFARKLDELRKLL